MSNLNNWLVPSTANEKNYRAVYRAANQGAYIEDLSYYQCIELESFNPDGKLISWVSNEAEETIGLVFQIQVSDGGKSLLWSHPGTEIHDYFKSRRQSSVMKCNDYAFFKLIGPQWVEKIGNFEENVKVLKLKDLPIFKDEEDDSSDEDLIVVSRLPNSIGFLLTVKKRLSYRLWLRFVHSKVVVGCLDSQEHLDIELERQSSSRLQQDIFNGELSHEQTELLKLAKHWSKSEDIKRFKILRDFGTLTQYTKAFQKGKPVDKMIGMNLPSFIPIVVSLRCL